MLKNLTLKNVYAKVSENGVQPYSIEQLKKDNPRTSFPKEIPPAVLEAYGVYLVNVEPPEGKMWSGSFEGNPPVAVFEDLPPPNADAVIAERSRRLALGFDYDFGDARGIHRIGTTPADMMGWDEVTMGANAAIALGGGSTAFNITTETGEVTVTAMEWQAILVAATQFRQPIWAASFALQAMDPIPANFADDSYWL